MLFRARRFGHVRRRHVRENMTEEERVKEAEAKETMSLVRDATGLSYSLDLFEDEVDLFGEFDN